ncbi:e3 ubiquitin-protein ligase RNF13 [Trichonephila clavipes]|nr:e3 ubiquitin-protein ligase RNF13 [Trichonephila clavipes]
MGVAIPNVLQPGVFVGLHKTQVALVEVLPVPGWRPMKQLAVREHFLPYGGVLNDWSVEGVLSLLILSQKESSTI